MLMFAFSAVRYMTNKMDLLKIMVIAFEDGNKEDDDNTMNHVIHYLFVDPFIFLNCG